MRGLCPLIAAVAFLVLLAPTRVGAVGPSILMFYGDGLTQPILVYTTASNTDGFWSPRNGGPSHSLPRNLAGRRYLSLAIFWGYWDPTVTLKPEDASQHARLYLPVGARPAVIVVTPPVMTSRNNNEVHAEPVPIPTSLDAFIAGWTLTPDEIAEVRELVPAY
jgi:hypothetical protein